MKRILLTVLIVLGLTACSTTNPQPTLSGPNTVVRTASYVLNIDPNIDAHRRGVIAKAVEASAPANLDIINVSMLNIHKLTAGLSGSFTEVYMLLPRNEVLVSDAILAFLVGHELAHREPDIGRINTPEEEIVCDAWGLMAIIDLGYNPREVIAWIRSLGHPDSPTHPSSERRAQKLEEVVRQYKGK